MVVEIYFGSDTIKAPVVRYNFPYSFMKGETPMSSGGKKDKGKKEQKKKPKHDLKEKRKLKHEKKQKGSSSIPS